MNRYQLQLSPDGDAGAGGAGAGTLIAPPPAGSGAPPPPGGQPPPNGQQTPPAGAVVAKPWREGWIQPDGKINKAAYENLPEHLKPFKDQFARHDTDEALLLAFAHQSSLIGKKGLMPLPAGASDKDKAEFNTRMREILRVPEKPEGYGLKRPENVPAELWNDDYAKGVSEIAHKHNVSPEALSELAKFDSDFAVKGHGESQAALEKQLNEGNAALQTAWGPEYQKNVQLASQAARTVGLDPSAHPAFRNADIVKAFAKFGAMVSSDKLVSGDSPGNTGGSDMQRGQDIINNKANPLNAAYWDANNPQHGQAMQQVEAFFKRASALKSVK